MFAARFFPNRYFAPRYFPNAGESAAASVSVSTGGGSSKKRKRSAKEVNELRKKIQWAKYGRYGLVKEEDIQSAVLSHTPEELEQMAMAAKDVQLRERLEREAAQKLRILRQIEEDEIILMSFL